MLRKCFAVLLSLGALPVARANAQDAMSTISRQVLGNSMVVVVKFSANRDPWEYAENMANATGMQLVGVSPSTHSAVYRVTNETNLSTGPVAGRNQQILMSQFPNTIEGYNFGRGYPAPMDLVQANPNPRRDNGYDQRRNDNQGRGNAYGRRPSYRLSDRDRATVVSWYDRGRNMNARLRVGDPLPPDLSSVSYPAPPDLTRQLSPMPSDFRYFIVGGSLVLLDGRNTVVDVIRFDTNR